MTDEVEVKRGPGRPRKMTDVTFTATGGELAPAVTVAAPAIPAGKFPVKMKRGYFPKDPDHPKHPMTGDAIKVPAGETAMLALEEARDLIKAGIAERADALP